MGVLNEKIYFNFVDLAQETHIHKFPSPKLFLLRGLLRPCDLQWQLPDQSGQALTLKWEVTLCAASAKRSRFYTWPFIMEWKAWTIFRERGRGIISGDSLVPLNQLGKAVNFPRINGPAISFLAPFSFQAPRKTQQRVLVTLPPGLLVGALAVAAAPSPKVTCLFNPCRCVWPPVQLFYSPVQSNSPESYN